MTTTPRYRSRSYGDFNSGGTYTKSGYYYNSKIWTQYHGPYDVVRGTEECWDHLTLADRRTPNDLKIEKIGGRYPTISGKGTLYHSSSKLWRKESYTYDNLEVRDGNMFPITTPPEINLDNWQNKILSNLSVNQPLIDLPLFLFELKDFPRMLRDLGRFKRGELGLDDVPDSYLSYRMGWGPMASDVYSLLELSGHFKSQLEYLTSLRPGKRIKRKLDVSEEIGPWLLGVYDRSGLFVSHRRTTTQMRTWFTARVGELDEHLIEEMTAMLRKARAGNNLAQAESVKQALGLSGARVETLWNAIPWSWLIDYFSSIGDFIEAIEGKLPFKVKDVCVMEETDRFIDSRISLRSIYETNTSIDTQLTDGRTHYNRKRRKVIGTPHPVIHTKPFLNGRQVSILGALALATRLR